MTHGIIEESQYKAARVAGLIYLFTDVTALVTAFVIRFKLIVPGNSAMTAQNIMASERSFRLCIALDLFSFAADVALLVALYVILKSVNRNLALLAAAWNLVGATILIVITLNNLEVLRLLSGDAYLQAFDQARLQALMMMPIGAYDAGYTVALIFAGLGSTVFSYLFFTSRYIPRILAGWGVFSSLLTTLCAFAFIIFPIVMGKFGALGFMPGNIFVLVTGFWLLIKGIRQPDQLRPMM